MRCAAIAISRLNKAQSTTTPNPDPKKNKQVPQFIIGIDPTARVAITTPTRKAATNLAKEVARQLGVRQYA